MVEPTEQVYFRPVPGIVNGLGLLAAGVTRTFGIWGSLGSVVVGGVAHNGRKRAFAVGVSRRRVIPAWELVIEGDRAGVGVVLAVRARVGPENPFLEHRHAANGGSLVALKRALAIGASDLGVSDQLRALGRERAQL